MKSVILIMAALISAPVSSYAITTITSIGFGIDRTPSSSIPPLSGSHVDMQVLLIDYEFTQLGFATLASGGSHENYRYYKLSSGLTARLQQSMLGIIMTAFAGFYQRSMRRWDQPYLRGKGVQVQLSFERPLFAAPGYRIAWGSFVSAQTGNLETSENLDWGKKAHQTYTTGLALNLAVTL